MTSKDIIDQIEAMERSAYQQGWNDAIAAIQQAASTVSTPQVGALSLVTKKPAEPNQRPVELIKAAAEFIKNNPGLTRQEVFREMSKADRSINVESLRTSIRRLIAREVVEDKDGKLF